MSAIAAIYYLDVRLADRGSLERIAVTLNHRGTDRTGLVVDRPVGLLHLNRSTTPESKYERLPRRSTSGAFMITCDARLDNRTELIEQLSLNRRSASSIPDSEIVLAAYEKWGQGCPARLLGDFVFVVWDGRKQELFAARDPLGIKHFYYYYQENSLFALASEIKALFEIEGIPRRLDEVSVGDYLVGNSEDRERTFFAGIRRLPATHALRVNRSGLRKWQYWQPSYDETKLKNHGEYQEAFRDKLRTAVMARTRTDRGLGAFLSGGLDSSSIVCLASRGLNGAGNTRLKTFSAVFPKVASLDRRIDERNYIDSVVKATGCEAHYIEADIGDPLRYMEQVVDRCDHPVGAPNVYMDCSIYEAAKREGVRVLLSGTDGDSTVSYGYEDFAHMVRRGMYWSLVRDAVALNKHMPGRKHTVKRSVWNRGIRPCAPPALVQLWRSARRRKPPVSDHDPGPFTLHYQAVKPDVRDRLELDDRSRRLVSANFPEGITRAEQHWRSLTSGHFSYVLEQLEKISAAFGIEVRYPFFDRNLIEFCITLPPGQRIYRGWTRSIFRHAMEGILPPDVQWRTDKSNIGASVKYGLLKYGRDHIEEALNASSDVLEKYVDLDVVRRAYKEYAADPMNKEREAMLLLTHVYLSNWLRISGLA